YIGHPAHSPHCPERIPFPEPPPESSGTHHSLRSYEASAHGSNSSPTFCAPAPPSSVPPWSFQHLNSTEGSCCPPWKPYAQNSDPIPPYRYTPQNHHPSGR